MLDPHFRVQTSAVFWIPSLRPPAFYIQPINGNPPKSFIFRPFFLLMILILIISFISFDNSSPGFDILNRIQPRVFPIFFWRNWVKNVFPVLNLSKIEGRK